MVEYIKAGTAKLPVRVSYKVLKKISTLSEEEGGQYDRVEQLLLFSLEAGHIADGIPFAMTRESLEDLIDRYPEIYGQFKNIMEAQMADLTGKIQGQDLEKVTHGPKSKNSASKTSD